MKWKFLLFILFKTYCFYTQTPIPVIDSNQNDYKKSSNSSKAGCSIPFRKYETGKRFYFPKIVEKEGFYKRVLSYKFITEDHQPVLEVFYDTLSGKTFTLDKIQDQYTRDKKGRIIELPYYLLKSEDGLVIKYHYNTVNLRQLTRDNEITLNYILPDAVYLDEVDNFKLEYLNTGKELYAIFPLNKKKYRKITILDVSPGSKDKPIHIVFSYSDVKPVTVGDITTNVNTIEKDSIDICDCGTNVLPVLIPNCKFKDFFTLEDPSKDLIAIDLYWDSIMNGEILIGMNKKHVDKALGNPIKITTEVKKTADDTTEIKTMSYKDKVIVLENDKVKSVQTIK